MTPKNDLLKIFSSCTTIAASLFLFLVFALFGFSVLLYWTGRREIKGLKWFQFWRKGDEKFPGVKESIQRNF